MTAATDQAQHHPKLPLGIGLAPMEGVTSFAMRVWFYLVSAPDSMGTPFLRVTDTFPHKTLPAAFAPELTLMGGQVPYRVVPQMMATETEDFLRTARYFPDHVPFVELNCGCPAPTCTGKGAGSSLLKDPSAFADMIGQLAEVLGPGRLAIKMRTGYHSADEFPCLLQGIKAVPLARLTVHGRSRPDRYKGHARWDLIQEAARTVSAPVMASGDVVDLGSYNALLQAAPAVQGLMIGRGALRHPWIFSELRSKQAISISREVLVHVIGTYVLLHELDITAPEKLHRCAQELFAEGSCGTSEDRWRKVFRVLTQALTEGKALGLGPEGEWPAIELVRNTIGRAKMLWNYMRSGLPEALFSPQILRSKNLTDLLVGIHRIAGQDGDAGLPIKHRPEVDWLYAGGREPENQSPDRTETEPEESCSLQ